MGGILRVTSSIFARYGLDPFYDMDEPLTQSRPKRLPQTKQKREKKPWKRQFVAVDGEGWDGKYTLLQISCRRDDLYNPKGLSTRAILKYLTDHWTSSQAAYVGFGLNYDFEMWLKDVSDEDFQRLLNGETIDFLGYQLSYIPRKMFTIRHSIRTGKKYTNPNTGQLEDDMGERELVFQDVLGFFQSSFEEALEKWHIDIPPIISEFKKLRGGFHSGMIAKIKEYNRAELAKLVELMEAFAQADQEAFEAIGLEPNHSGRIWYGPGSRAKNLLTQTKWINEHPALTMPKDTPKWARLGLLPETSVREVAEFLAAEEDAKIPYSDIVGRVKDVGGLTWHKDSHYFEEILSLPKGTRQRIRNKHGMPLDELADELNMTVNDLLDALQKWQPQVKHHPRLFMDEAMEKLLQEDPAKLFEHMFAASYYGGRIEAAAQGQFTGTLYDYDVNSAYPYAITNLPRWMSDDLMWVDGFDPQNRQGMYFVRWQFPTGTNFYPFPFRAQNGNVYFPRMGAGWVMSPEVCAAKLHFEEGELYETGAHGFKKLGFVVVGGFVLRGTDGCGDGLSRPPHPCSTADKMVEMADFRLKSKAAKKRIQEGRPEPGDEGLERAEKQVKLFMNSTYGKLIQQIGSHKFLNTFAASWTTSTCRALILRAAGNDRTNNVISIMTDGILTRNPLSVNEGNRLGQYELTKVEGCIQLIPGIYRLDTDLKGKKHTLRYRGVGKRFSYLKSLRVLEHKEEYDVHLRLFVSRTLSIHMPDAFGDKRYQFIDITRKEEFSLKSKREGKTKLTKRKRFQFLPPKSPPEGFDVVSKPYELDIEPIELSYDFCQSEEELLSRGLSSILLDEMI